jgi:hypothetical protein
MPIQGLDAVDTHKECATQDFGEEFSHAAPAPQLA